MSTTFDVYPGKGHIPLFSELLYETAKEVNNYLRGIDVNKDMNPQASYGMSGWVLAKSYWLDE